jgi:hypothetical protein
MEAMRATPFKTAVLGARPRAKILLEASTESESVARHPESLGHEVIVADPNFAPMYATRAADEDRSAGCAHVDGSMSARGVSHRAIG